MPLPLIGMGVMAGLGSVKAIMANQAKDPNSKLYQLMLDQARESREMSKQNVAGGQIGNLRNAVANRLSQANMRTAGSGRANIGMTAGNEASIISQGAGMENNIIQDAVRRRTGLIDQANQMQRGVAQGRADFKRNKKAAVTNSLLGGIGNAVTYGSANYQPAQTGEQFPEYEDWEDSYDNLDQYRTPQYSNYYGRG